MVTLADLKILDILTLDQAMVYLSPVTLKLNYRLFRMTTCEHNLFSCL